MHKKYEISTGAKPLVFCDIDDTLYSKDKVYEMFPWGIKHRGMSFYRELMRRHGLNGWKKFFQIFTRDILEQRVWTAAKSEGEVIFLTTGTAAIQQAKIARLLPGEFQQNRCLAVESQANKADTIHQFLKSIYTQTAQIPPSIKIFDDLSLPSLEQISDSLQISVEHISIKLD